jgi:hypothetical protein
MNAITFFDNHFYVIDCERSIVLSCNKEKEKLNENICILNIYQKQISQLVVIDIRICINELHIEEIH